MQLCKVVLIGNFLFSRHYTSTVGVTTLNYSPTDCFQTFPFPLVCCEDLSSQKSNKAPTTNPNNDLVNQLEEIGEKYYNHRQQIMLTRQEGLSKTYNRFHNPEETSKDIKQLRQLHVKIDYGVAAAYRWKDLNLDHGFHQTKQGLRYTISEAARREILDRLL